MSLYLRILIFWVILWSIPYLVAKVQWKLYDGNFNYKYWRENNSWWIIFRILFMLGIIGFSLLGFLIFTLWLFPELN